MEHFMERCQSENQAEVGILWTCWHTFKFHNKRESFE